jgi:hypothetical protein
MANRSPQSRGFAWRDLPEAFGTWNSAFQRFRRLT